MDMLQSDRLAKKEQTIKKKTVLGMGGGREGTSGNPERTVNRSENIVRWTATYIYIKPRATERLLITPPQGFMR